MKVFAGHRITTVVTDSGRVYSWGYNSAAASTLGHASRGAAYLKCGGVTSVTHCFPGGGGGNADDDKPTYSIAITEKNSMYGWGKGGGGKMGALTKPGTIQLPPELSDKSSITSVAAGGSFTIAATSCGSILVSGNNDACQLGLGDTAPRRNFALLPFPSVSFTVVAAGVNHAGAVTSSGELFTWGWGENGRLGLGDDSKRQSPTLVEALKDDLVFVTDVAFGSAHSCILSDQGDVYCWGWNLYGQCGVPNEASADSSAEFSSLNPQGKNAQNDAPTCILLPRLALAEQIITSLSAGFAHTAAVSAVGCLFTWGFGEEGQLGHGHEGNEFAPRMVSFDGIESNLRCLSVACGHTHTAAVVSKLSSVQNDERRREGGVKRAAASTLLKFFRSALMKTLLHKKYRPVPKVKAAKKAAVIEEVLEDQVDYEEIERMKVIQRREEEDRRRKEREEQDALARRMKEEAEAAERERLRLEAEIRERLKREAEEEARRKLEDEEERRRQELLEEQRRQQMELRKRQELEEIARFNENEAMRKAEEEQRLAMAARRASMLLMKAKREEREKAKAADMLAKEVKRLSDAKKAAERLKKGREKKEKVLPTEIKRSGSAQGLRADSTMQDRLKAMASEKKMKEEADEREKLKKEERDAKERAKKEKEREKMVAKREERLRAEKLEREEREREERAEEWARREEEEKEERDAREEEERLRQEAERKAKALKQKMGKTWEPSGFQYVTDNAPAKGGMPGGEQFKSASQWGRKLSKTSATGVENRRGLKK
jgi:alpha-tubulin suppressor-like RCC1 family protein